jgi:hypothetical protein
LVDDAIPEWMKPSEINAIITVRDIKGIKYLDLQEAGEKLRVEVLNWFVLFALQKKANVHYRIDGGSNRIGSQQFHDAMDGLSETTVIPIG